MKLSVLIPSIRTTNWNQVLTTLKDACKRYQYEVIFSGPFGPPPGTNMSGVKHVLTYSTPSVAAQLGTLQCEGELLYHTVDDARFVPDSLDMAIDLYTAQCNEKDILNCRYTEGDDYYCNESLFPPDFWYAYFHPPLRLPGIPSHYKFSLHFLVNTKYFIEMGGFDCNYEYLNFNLHDISYRFIASGGKIIDSPTTVAVCNHYGNGRVDHKVIEDAYPHDYAKFLAKYSNPNALTDNLKIDFDNWKNQPEVWSRRFGKKLYGSYEEMLADN